MFSGASQGAFCIGSACLNWDDSTGFISFDNLTPYNQALGIASASIKGPSTAPTGSCSPSGIWVFSQDGVGSFCKAGTWEVVFTAP
jgi:hypothetical protein